MAEANELLERLANYVRLEIETGNVKPNSPVGIAWRDYAERFEVPEASSYYQGVLQKVAALYHAAGVEFTTRPTKHASDARKSALKKVSSKSKGSAKRAGNASH